MTPPPEPTTEIVPAPDPTPVMPLPPEPATEILPPPEPEPPREPWLGPAMRTAGAASGRGLLAAAVVAAGLARGFAHYSLVFLRAVGVQLVLAGRLLRRHAPTAGRFFAELAAFGAAAVTGLGRFSYQYVRTWRGELAAWRATRRWQESRPEPPQNVRPPSPNGSRPGSAPTRSAPPARRAAVRGSRTTRSSATSTRPRSSAARARSTGAASRASTRARASPRCSAGPSTAGGARAGRCPVRRRCAATGTTR